MITDTGAGRNVIKQIAVNAKLPIDEEIVLKLAGINNLPEELLEASNVLKDYIQTIDDS